MPIEKPRVLLVSANTEEEPHPVYPLALDVLQTTLHSRGIESAVWDRACHDQPLEKIIEGFDPHLLGVSIRNIDNNDGARPRFYLPEIFDLIAGIKRFSNAPLALGGSGFSLFPNEILRRSNADFGIAGAGEQAFADLAECVARRKAPEHVPGLFFRNGKRNPSKTYSPEPGAVRRNANLARSYFERGGSINVQIKRGCPHECVYCAYPGLEGGRVFARSIRNCVDEIQALYSAAAVDSFFVVDSVFNLDPGNARDFAEDLAGRALPVKWTAFFMPKNVEERDVVAWRKSGIEGVEFGVDTLSPRLLEKWGKPFTVQDVEKSARLCAEQDVPYVLYLLFGGPGETSDTVKETLERAASLPRAVVYAFQGMRVYPGSRLHQIALNEKMLDPSHDLLAPFFYFSPGLARDTLHAELEPFSRQRNWLVAGNGMEQAKKMSAFIRRSGRKGSLWHLLRPGAAAR